jgi:hypothetical protein
MLKKYQSKSSISLSVLMNTGKSVHVSFDSLTGGGSIFYTDDEELQEALAKHHKYGRLFKEVELVKPVAEPVVKQKPVVKEEEVEDVEDIDEVDDTEDEVDETEYETTEENAEDEATEENAEEVQEQEAPVATGKQIHVTNLEDAKNYLADNLGVSRTKLRSKKAILEVAEANGIVFVGI